MSLAQLRVAIDKKVARTDVGAMGSVATALIRSLESVWPTLESAIGLIARLAGLPTVVFVGGWRVFEEDLAPERSVGSELIHKEVDAPSIGGVDLFFVVPAEGVQGDVRISQEYSLLLESARTGRMKVMLSPSSLEAIDTIVRVVNVGMESTINFYTRTIGMTHELTMVLQGTSALLSDVLEETREAGRMGILPSDFEENVDIIESEYECALYVLRNFLSDAGYDSYGEAQRKEISEVDLVALAHRIIRIYSRTGRGGMLRFENELPDRTPVIRGDRLELERLFHNVFSNAVKYSYVPSPGTSARSIRVFAQVPFGRRAGRQEWAMCIQNYGVGLTESEKAFALRPGFRGSDAKRQVALGAGIGLSEAQKIISAHGGRIRIRSDFKHRGKTGDVYLTTVSLIFPLAEV